MNPYQTLQIQQPATQQQIKSAYRRLAKQYHPDVNKAPSAPILFQAINTAFELLSKKQPLPSPAVEAKREKKRSAAMAGLKLYEFVTLGQSVIISCGYDETPANTVVFLMFMDREYRVFLEHARKTPFTLQLTQPNVKMTITK